MTNVFDSSFFLLKLYFKLPHLNKNLQKSHRVFFSFTSYNKIIKIGFDLFFNKKTSKT